MILNFHILKKIELADNSKKQCYDSQENKCNLFSGAPQNCRTILKGDIGIKLIYLRTMTHGTPYYSKFGFTPVLKTDYTDVFIYNKQNFELNKTMTRDELLNIIQKKKKNMTETTYNIYKKYIKQLILNREIFDPMIFITQTIKIVDTQEILSCDKIYGAHHKIDINFIGCNSMLEKKKIKIIEDKKELAELCNFVSKIYIDIYKFLGYRDYEENLWELIIKRNVKKS